MSDLHETPVCSLPLKIPNLICSCVEQRPSIRICLGCYSHFCFNCFQSHRQEISIQLGHIIHNDDIILQAILLDGQSCSFNPVQLHKEIEDYQKIMINGIKRSGNQALKSLRAIMDKRSDELVQRLNPITANNLISRKEFAKYIETHWNHFRKELYTENKKLEKELTMKVIVRTNYMSGIDWQNLIELKEVSNYDVKQTDIINDLVDPCFEHLDKDHRPLKTIEDQGQGNAIAASRQHLMFAVNGNELCIVEPYANYRLTIPLPVESSSSRESIDIIDICWSSTANMFIVITSNQLYTVNLDHKIPTIIQNIKTLKNRQFSSCTCSFATLLLCFTGKGSPIQQWMITDWKPERTWDPPDSCHKNAQILCIRFSQDGSLIGIASDATLKAFRFEVRTFDTMTCVWSQEIIGTMCSGIISLNKNVWLVGVFCYHKIFILDQNHSRVKEVTMTKPAKSSLRGITLVNSQIVAVRTAKTVILFDLYN